MVSVRFLTIRDLPYLYLYRTFTLNKKFGGPKKMLCLFLARNAKAIPGTSTHPPYVGATLPRFNIGGKFSGFALLP